MGCGTRPAGLFFGSAVGDDSGGILVEGGGTDAQGDSVSYLIDLDAQTGNQKWQYFAPPVMFVYPPTSLDSNVAIGLDGTIFVVEHGCAHNFTGETTTNLDCLNEISGDSGSLLSQVVIPTSSSYVSVGPHCDIAQSTDISINSGPTTVPAIMPDGSVYIEIETSQSTSLTVCDTNGVTGTSSGSSSSSLLQVFPGGGMELQPVNSSSTESYSPGDVIPDGNGGVLASAASNDGGLTMTDIGPGGTTQSVFSNVGLSGTPASSMVLGDDNTAFATDETTVVAFDATTLQQKWSYASTGGGLSFVVATSGGGVTINDSSQGVIQLDSSGNASAPIASLQAAMPFQPGLPIFIGQDGTVSGAWNNGVNGVLSSIAGVYAEAAPSVYPEPSGEGQNQHASVPTVTSLTVHFTGSKSSEDLLSFPTTPPADSQTCSQNLGGPINCPAALNGTGTWVWNVEIAATVTNDASKWRAQQAVGTLGSGRWRDSQGGLHTFGGFTNKPCFNDNPCDDLLPTVTQQARGQKLIFWLDAPGSTHYADYPGLTEPIDSLTQVQNFISSVCNRANICAGVNWSLKLVIDPGGVPEAPPGSQARLGHIPF